MLYFIFCILYFVTRYILCTIYCLSEYFVDLSETTILTILQLLVPIVIYYLRPFFNTSVLLISINCTTINNTITSITLQHNKSCSLSLSRFIAHALCSIANANRLYSTYCYYIFYFERIK